MLDARGGLPHVRAMTAAFGHSMIPAWRDGVLQPMDKLDVHSRGLRHMAVSVFIVDGARTLIQKRAAGKYHTPGLWANACCTHPDWEEAPDRCAIRRLRQEIGASGLVVEHADEVEYRADVGGGMVEHEIVQIYRAQASARDLRLTLNPDEVSAVRWLEVEALVAEIASNPERFTPWLRIYMKDHRERIFGDA